MLARAKRAHFHRRRRLLEIKLSLFQIFLFNTLFAKLKYHITELQYVST